MTPYERILRNKGMEQFAFEQEKPRSVLAPFPRNNTALAVLTFAVIPLLYKAILDPTAINIAGYGAVTTGFGAAIWCLAQGLKTEALYHGARVAKAPRLPLKFIGAGLAGLSGAALTLFQGGVPVQAAAVAFVMMALGVIAFGGDPRREKGLETTQKRQSHKLDAVTARVGRQMERVREAASLLADPDVMPRVRAFDESVDALLTAALRDPERVTGLRKFFGVYLDSAAEASERFASVFSGTGDPVVKQKYITLLDKLEQAFAAKAHDYAAAGQLKLDVEIDVLDGHLTREGAVAA